MRCKSDSWFHFIAALSSCQLDIEQPQLKLYEIIEELGHGNMGVVYKVRHRSADKIMDMKVLRSELAADSINVKRFQQELQTTSLLSHPNIVPIYDSGVSDAAQVRTPFSPLVEEIAEAKIRLSQCRTKFSAVRKS